MVEKHNILITINDDTNFLLWNISFKVCITLMNKNSEIYGACRHKHTFRPFPLSTDYPVYQIKGLDHTNNCQTLQFENVNGPFSTGSFLWSRKIEKEISY